MSIEFLVRHFVPKSLKEYFRREVARIAAEVKTPKMVWGYQDSSGEFRPRTRLSNTVFLYYPERITIEDNVFVWHYTILDGTGGLTIGEGTQIGAWVGVFSHSSHIAIRVLGRHYTEVEESHKAGYKVRGVSIGRCVFIGAGSIILPGASIGDGALISAGSVVHEPVAPFAVVAGNPAKVTGTTTLLDRRYLRDPEIKKWYEEWQRDGSISPPQGELG